VILNDPTLVQNRRLVGTILAGVIVGGVHTVVEVVMLEALIAPHHVHAPPLGEGLLGQASEEDLRVMNEEVLIDHLSLILGAIQCGQAGLEAGLIPRGLQVALVAARIRHILAVIAVAVAVAAAHLEVEDVEVIVEMIYEILVLVPVLVPFAVMTEYTIVLRCIYHVYLCDYNKYLVV